MTIIDGIAVASQIKTKVAEQVKQLAAQGLTAGLAAVIVGENAASQVYVRNKIKTARDLGITSFEHKLPVGITEQELLALIAKLNADPAVSAILVQLPLPPQIDSEAAIAAISPDKDVDGFHPINVGALVTGKPGFVPCTPLGCMALLRSVKPKLAGLHAVVVGRSNIVGKPVAHLLLREDCTVTIAHSKTSDLPGVVRSADIVVAAVGRAEMIGGSWIKQGAIVIDVGINRVPTADGKTKIVGDVAFESARVVAGAITPVPGGVGPMTVAFLMANTCRAAFLAHGLPFNDITH